MYYRYKARRTDGEDHEFKGILMIEAEEKLQEIASKEADGPELD